MFSARKMIFAKSQSTFDPLSLSPALWLDASDSSTLYDATSGGSLVVADGAVARWEDKSGNARHAIQAASVNRPIRKVSLQNGKDMLRFDGTNHWMLANAVSSVFHNEAPYTILFVLKDVVSGSGKNFAAASRSDADNYFFTFGQEGGNIFTLRKRPLSQANEKYAFGGTTGSNKILTLVYTGTHGTAHTNGVASATSDMTTDTFGTVPSQFTVGSYRDNRYNTAFNGNMGELIIIPSALNAGDLLTITTYLNAKWAVY